MPHNRPAWGRRRTDGEGAGLKIALVTPYSLQQPGGVPEHVGHLRQEFQALGHDATIIAPRGERGGIEASPGFYGIGRSMRIPAGGSRANLTFDVTLYAQVKAIMRREQFDVVHLHEPLMPVLPYMVLLNSNAANVATFHAYRTANLWYTAFKPYMAFIMGRMDAKIAVSEPAREFVSQYFRGTYDVVPNGIDTALFGDGVEPFPWAHDGAPRILFVGRFDESRKGFKYLLKAMALVRLQFPEARLTVVGTGDREKYDGVMDRYNLYTCVDFAGFVAKEELPRYYASCDILCVPSTGNESFGIVLLEGMAAGKPVVASAIPGYASVLTSEHEGILVEPKEPTDLAIALVRLLQDRELRDSMGRTGLSTANRHSWRWIAERVLTVYDQAMHVAPRATWRRRLA